MKRDNKGRFMKGEMSGINSPSWSGDNVGYSGIHTWIKKILGNATRCKQCGKEKTTPKSIHWANISGLYKRDETDWIPLCSICHRKFDGITKLNKIDALNIKTLYMRGKKQKELSNMFGVDQGTISNIINNKIKYYAS